MRRRMYLSVLVTGSVAGCGEVLPEEEPEGDSEPPESETAEPEPEPDGDPEPEVEPEAEEEPTPEVEEELTEDEQFALQRIQEGDALLAEAIEIYADSGSGDSMLDARCSILDNAV